MDTAYPKVQGRCNTPQSMTVDIDALQALFIRGSDEGMTIDEIATASDMSPSRVRKLIKGGVLSGDVGVGKRWVEQDWDGRGRHYVVYQMRVTE